MEALQSLENNVMMEIQTMLMDVVLHVSERLRQVLVLLNLAILHGIRYLKSFRLVVLPMVLIVLLDLLLHDQFIV
jgi:hypothetical protein